jgi:hypothetical protein
MRSSRRRRRFAVTTPIIVERVRNLSDVPRSPALAIIINCGTKWITSLALLSALRYARYPVVLIDCESTDGSLAHFERLATAGEVFLLEWPLRPHGAALDRVFGETTSESILLVDSDLEILGSQPVAAMAAALRGDARAYGAGFVQRAQWLDAAHGLPGGVGWYAERMWIPLVHLATRPVRAALQAGASFLHQREFVELPGRPRLSRLLATRFWMPGIGAHAAATRAGATFADSKPAFVEYDTGARLHRQLAQDGYRYAEIDKKLWGDVRHCHGVTRQRLRSTTRKLLRTLNVLKADNAMAQAPASAAARARLADEYGVDLADR